MSRSQVFRVTDRAHTQLVVEMCVCVCVRVFHRASPARYRADPLQRRYKHRLCIWADVPIAVHIQVKVTWGVAHRGDFLEQQ